MSTSELLRSGSAWLRSRREQSKLAKATRSSSNTYGVPSSEPSDAASTPGAQAQPSAWLAAGQQGYQPPTVASSSTAAASAGALGALYGPPVDAPREKAPLNDWEIWNEEEAMRQALEASRLAFEVEDDDADLDDPELARAVAESLSFDGPPDVALNAHRRRTLSDSTMTPREREQHDLARALHESDRLAKGKGRAMPPRRSSTTDSEREEVERAIDASLHETRPMLGGRRLSTSPPSSPFFGASTSRAPPVPQRRPPPPPVPIVTSPEPVAETASPTTPTRAVPPPPLPSRPGPPAPLAPMTTIASPPPQYPGSSSEVHPLLATRSDTGGSLTFAHLENGPSSAAEATEPVRGDSTSSAGSGATDEDALSERTLGRLGTTEQVDSDGEDEDDEDDGYSYPMDSPAAMSRISELTEPPEPWDTQARRVPTPLHFRAPTPADSMRADDGGHHAAIPAPQRMFSDRTSATSHDYVTPTNELLTPTEEPRTTHVMPPYSGDPPSASSHPSHSVPDEPPSFSRPVTPRSLAAISSLDEEHDEATSMSSAPAFARAVRVGFPRPGNAADDGLRAEAMQGTIVLTNVASLDGAVDADRSTFAIESQTWATLLRFLMWHGNTRIEAGSRDLQAERPSNAGEAELETLFYAASHGRPPRVRLTVRLMRPDEEQHGAHRPVALVARHSRTGRTLPTRSTPLAIVLPDYLVLPSTLSELAVALYTLRHLASIACSTQPAKSSTDSYRALRQLGSAIENLARSNGEAQSSPATEHSVMRSLRRRLRLAPKEDLEDHDEIAVAPKNARRIEPFQVRPVAA